MQSSYYKTFNYFEGLKPTHLGIYFSLFLHLSILLFAIGLPNFFKPNKITSPNVIPIEIVNISDVTSLSSKKDDIKNNNKQNKAIKKKNFNSSENTEIQKIKLLEKPKVKNTSKNNNVEVLEKEISKNQIFSKDNQLLQLSDSKKISLQEKKINKINEEKIIKKDNVETLKIDKIKPKLKPKPIEKIEQKTDIQVEKKIQSLTKKENKNKDIAKPKPTQKPEPEFNLATMLKDLRNEDILKVSNQNNEEDDQIENNEDTNLEVTISEMDLVIQQLRSCFNPRAGTQIVGDEMVKISAKIDKQAFVRKDTVQIIATNISKSNPYYEAITESAAATLYNPLCSKLKLPLNKYESWRDLKIIIDYSWIKN